MRFFFFFSYVWMETYTQTHTFLSGFPTTLATVWEWGMSPGFFFFQVPPHWGLNREYRGCNHDHLISWGFRTRRRSGCDRASPLAGSPSGDRFKLLQRCHHPCRSSKQDTRFSLSVYLPPVSFGVELVGGLCCPDDTGGKILLIVRRGLCQVRRKQGGWGGEGTNERTEKDIGGKYKVRW